MARPSKFENVDWDFVRKCARMGLSDIELAKIAKVTERTWNNWKQAQPEFFQSLKNWKDEADNIVEASLYERAKGYSHPEDKIFIDNGQPIVVPTVKHYPPDTTACIFWLKNRKRAEWRDRTEVDNTHKIDSLDKLLDEIDGNRWQPKGGE